MSKYFIIGLILFSNIILSIGVYIRICNHGGYLAKCYLQSQASSYGFQMYKFDTGLFPIFQCSKLYIPFDADWSRVECKSLAFIAVYKTIFTQEFSSELLNTCYVITGTTLNPAWSQTNC